LEVYSIVSSLESRTKYGFNIAVDATERTKIYLQVG
jgi:hypothetical protein